MALALLPAILGLLAGPAAAEAASGGAAPADAAYLPELVARARAQHLADSRLWRVLGHYRRQQTGGWKSDADGLGFFFAGARGRLDPAAELDATLAAMFEPPLPFDAQHPDVGQHAQCRFPARWAFLKGALGVDPARLPDRPCPFFEFWRGSISAQAVTLLYATAYLNSPASMYGHTLLRLSRSTTAGNPLLDYALNFAADVDTTNGLVYAWKGLTGMFRGLFYVMPYYVKVQEYSNMESRDLWEYDLDLAQDEIDRLVAHAWETRTTYFDYFFFTENCSYQLLALLEVARPSLRLLDRFDARVLPSDTIRAVLDQPGLVRATRSRPSLRATMAARRDGLGGDEADAAERVEKNGRAAEASLGALSAERRARVVDAAYDLLRYHEGYKNPPSERFVRLERELLVMRGHTGAPPQPVAARAGIDAPERGHPTMRLEAGAGFSNRSTTFETLSLRGALHDYLDPPAGYPEEAVLEMGHLHLRFDNEARRVALDRLDVVNIVSAAPWRRWVHKPSWMVWFGGDQARELGCDGWGCLIFAARGGSGLATRLGAGRALAFLMAESDVGLGPALAAPYHYRLGLGATGGFVAAITPRWRVEVETRWDWYLLGDRRRVPRVSVGQSLWLGRGAALRATTAIAGAYAEAALALLAYF